jgi:hypothetical protein
MRPWSNKMTITVILSGRVSACRRATVVVPDSVSADELVEALNRGEATLTNTAVVYSDKIATSLTAHEILSQVLVWSIESVLPAQEETAPAPKATDCASRATSTREELLRQWVAKLNFWTWESMMRKDIATTRKNLAAASALYKLAGGGIHDEGFWLFNMKSAVCTLQGNHKGAQKYGAQSMKIALAMHGDQHPKYAVGPDATRKRRHWSSSSEAVTLNVCSVDCDNTADRVAGGTNPCLKGNTS